MSSGDFSGQVVVALSIFYAHQFNCYVGYDQFKYPFSVSGSLKVGQSIVMYVLSTMPMEYKKYFASWPLFHFPLLNFELLKAISYIFCHIATGA